MLKRILTIYVHTPPITVTYHRGKRDRVRSGCVTAASHDELDLRLFGDREGVVDLDAKISHGALELGMAEKQLDGAQIMRSPIDQCRFGPAQRVRATRPRVEPDSGGP